ncbi:MAG: methanethiol S-methyltransferase [Dokdonella sp.]
MNPFYIVYSAVSYALFLAWFLYAIGFVGDMFVPKSINAPEGAGGWTALVIDVTVLAAFSFQHSLMARPAFKRWWTRVVPSAIERSTYVLFSSLFFGMIFVAWQPLPTPVWDLRGTPAAPVLLAFYVLGWLIVLLASFMINHFELFGLAQVWRKVRERPAPDSVFTEKFLYRFVRHPIMLGLLIAFWAAPEMTQGRLLFALLTSAYIVIGVRLEERDLIKNLGAKYLNYRARVPMLLPLPLPLPLPKSEHGHEAVRDKPDTAH